MVITIKNNIKLQGSTAKDKMKVTGTAMSNMFHKAQTEKSKEREKSARMFC